MKLIVYPQFNVACFVIRIRILALPKKGFFKEKVASTKNRKEMHFNVISAQALIMRN